MTDDITEQNSATLFAVEKMTELDFKTNETKTTKRKSPPKKDVTVTRSYISSSNLNTDIGPNELIQELTRALRNDPQLIFQWVYENIEHTPINGVQKGAACIIDRSGTSFDQSSLLIALLRQAKANDPAHTSIVEANFVYGKIQLSLEQCQSILGTKDSINVSKDVFTNGGFSTTLVGTAPNQVLELGHCWVQLKLTGDLTFVLDPSFKSYQRTAGLSDSELKLWMGYSNVESFMLGATEGATIDSGGTWVQNLNTDNIDEQLNELSMSLIAAIRKHDSDWNATISGSVTVGDQLMLSVYHSSFPSGMLELVYEIQPSDVTPAAVAAALSNAINNDTALTSAGVSAMANDIVVTLSNETSTSYIAKVNEGALTSFHVKPNQPASIETIIGGKSIVPIDLPFDYQTSLPYQSPSDTPSIWTDIPDDYRVRLDFDGASFGFNDAGYPFSYYSDELYGKRLTIFFDDKNEGHTANTPRLTLDGEVIRTGIPQDPRYPECDLFIRVYHNAYPTPTDRLITFRTSAQFGTSPKNTFYYCLGIHLGATSKALVDYHQRRFSINSYDAGSTGELDEPALGEGLAVQWSTYIAELSLVRERLGQMTGTVYQNHHWIGMTAYVDGNNNTGGVYFNGVQIDVQGSRYSISRLDANYGYNKNSLEVMAMTQGIHGYGHEMLAIQQVTGFAAASAIRIFHAANSAGVKIYKSDINNWDTIKNQLMGYSDADKGDIRTGIAGGQNIGTSVYLPQSSPYSFEQMTGRGWAYFNSASGCGGRYLQFKGGGQTKKGNLETKIPIKPCQCTIGDPVNVRTGDFTYKHEDLRIGSADYPYSLSLESSYDSRLRLVNDSMGLGWRHNWMSTATVDSGAFEGLGMNSPISAAATIVQWFVLLDVLGSDNTLPVENVLTVNECHFWWIAQNTNNIVEVNLPYEQYRFVLLPDGSFNPPPEARCELVFNGSSYSVIENDKTEYLFNTDGQLGSIVLPFGVTVSLEYDSNGVLQTVSNGLARTLSFQYTNDLLTSVSDGTGRAVSYLYDSNLQITQFTDALGQNYTFDYDLPGRMEKLFRPQNPSAAALTNTYDAVDRVATQVNILGELRSFFFADSSRTEEIDALNNSTIYEFDLDGNMSAMVNAAGYKTVDEFDAKQRVTQRTMPEGNGYRFVYDSDGNLLQIVKFPKPESNLANVIVISTYDPECNKLKTVRDGKGNVYVYTYDHSTGHLGNLLKVQYPSNEGQIPIKTMTYSRGQITSITDPTNIVTKYFYSDSNETLIQAIEDFGFDDHLNLTTSFDYDSVGNITSITDFRGNTTSMEYDVLRRFTLRTEPLPFGFTTSFTYDQNDNLLALSRSNGGFPQTYSFSYSMSNMRLTSTNPTGALSQWTYDELDRVSSFIDAENRTWTVDYDVLHRCKQIINPSNTVIEKRDYTPNGFYSSRTDAKNKSIQMTYDGFDRLDKTIFPDSTFEQHSTYDENDNVLTFYPRTGVNSRIEFTYDEMNRVKSKSFQSQSSVTYSYDLSGRIVEIHKDGTGDPSSGTLSFSHDSAGRFYKETYPDGKNVVHELDNNGNPVRTTWPDGFFIERTFDALNRLVDIFVNGAITAAAHYSYNDLSQRTQIDFENGTTTQYSHSVNNDLLGIEHQFSDSSVNLAYNFNLVHELTHQSASDSHYIWSPSSTSSISYGTANDVNEYPLPLEYDNNGNLSYDGLWHFLYDNENNLISASDATTDINFSYDPIFRQSQKMVSGVSTTRYIYSGWQRIADYDGNSDNLLARYVYGSSLDEPILVVSNDNQVTYMHTDRLGSVIAQSGLNGDLVNVYSYSPSGECDNIVSTSIGFTGQRLDNETGLYYCKRRYYHPRQGRFMQTDPIGYFGGDTNLYTYAFNSPLNFKDPFGLESKVPRAVDVIFVTDRPAYYNSVANNFAGFTVVVAHGQYGFMSDRLDPTSPGAHTMSVDDLIKKLRDAGKDKKPIIFGVCRAANDFKDKNGTWGSIASRVADTLDIYALAFTGLVAADNDSGTPPATNHYHGVPDQFSQPGQPPGYWQIFDPKGKKVGPNHPTFDEALEAFKKLCKV